MRPDPRAFLAVVILLGLALLGCIAAVAVLAGTGAAVPDVLKEALVGALTGLAGLLTHPPTDPAPAPVVVQQPDGEPVPVADTPPPDPAPDPAPVKGRRRVSLHPQPATRRDPYGLGPL